MGERETFWIDHDFERFGAHVRRNLPQFADAWGDIAPVTFACTAWRLATEPSLTPGYVRWHRRVLHCSCSRNAWDGSLTAHAMLVSPLPAQLTESREWWRDRGWREWPQTFGQFLEPTDQDVARSPHVRGTLLVDVPVPLDRLPAAPDEPDESFEDTARHAVAAVVKELNELLDPIIGRLEI